ncbi:hypothetical protein ROZALSC1DRAFT_20652, partial [Rozella allomycis CSF55]
MSDYESSFTASPVKKSVKKPLQQKRDNRPVEEVYQKKTQLEHILLRPDTYIGSVESITQGMWIVEQGKFVYKNITYTPGFYKIFDEILVNAADNKQRDPGMGVIRVDIDRENNVISVMNDGRGIPIEVHADEKVYVPELIFGHLLTSSNYNDSQKKVTGGRNGFGAKLCNIFSTEFVVETADSSKKKKFRQVFKKNMSEVGQPKIVDYSKDDFTKITFKPDLKRFGMETFDEDVEKLFVKRVYDMAGVVKDVKVYLNGERIKIKDFKSYVNQFVKEDENGVKPTVLFEKSDRWEVGFCISEGQFQQGGTHVAHVADQIVGALVEATKKKNKAAPLKPFQIKNQMALFINCLIENPSFDSQTKETMTLKQSSFGSKCILGEEFMKKVLKSGIVENILNVAQAKQNQMLKKSDGHKTSRISGIPKLDDANYAGTKSSSQCTLILTEGDSAKTLAVQGLSVVGRDYFGVFPLRGKLLNVREASAKQILENQEIQNIKRILGLQQGKNYTSA